MYLAFVYDCICLFRTNRKRKFFLTFTENTLFWLYATYKSLSYLYEYAEGTLRVYMLVFALSGAILYEVGIGRYYLKFVRKLFTMKLVKGKIKHGKKRSNKKKSDAEGGAPQEAGKQV